MDSFADGRIRQCCVTPPANTKSRRFLMAEMLKVKAALASRHGIDAGRAVTPSI